MPDDEEPESPPGRARALISWTMAIAGPTLLWFGAFALVAAVSADEVGPGECHGIGWGCTLTDRESAWLAALGLGVVVVPVSTLITIGLTAASRAPRGERASAVVAALLVTVGVLAFAAIGLSRVI